MTIEDGPAIISCPSAITQVTVHAQGARVTRTLALPQSLPEGELILEVAGLPLSAQPSSVRVSVHGERRQLVSARASLWIPERASQEASLKAQIEALEDQLARHERERALLTKRRQRVLDQQLAPAHDRTWRAEGPDARIQDALGVSVILDERQQAVDARLLTLQATIEDPQRELERLRLDAAQGASQQLDDLLGASWRVLISLRGAGHPERVELHYTVQGARWWPVYTLHLSRGGQHARHVIEALVAQDSGEDWDHVPLRLSTASMLHEATLPELPSLRLGKAQPARKSGYRPAPQGLDRLFASMDEAGERLGWAFSAPGHLQVEALLEQLAKDQAQQVARRPEPVLGGLSHELMKEAKLEAYDRGATSGELARAGGGGPPRPSAPLPPPAMSMPVGAIAPQAPGAAPMRELDRAAPRKKSVMPSMDFGASRSIMADEEREEGAASWPDEVEGDHEELAAQGISPQDRWLDFDALALAGPGERQRRGRLRALPAAYASPSQLAQAQLAASKLGVVDPAISRGHYDHRFDAAGLAQLPSDGRLHRVEVMASEGPARQWWRAVPGQEEQVYRMARVANPHDVPLLQGPMDVFVEGSFLLSTTLSTIDVGADMLVGLGVDERIRVARNATMEELKEGFLIQNKTALVHKITTELSSSLGFDARVELLDRAPVTDDRDVHIELGPIDPAHEPYDQAEQGQAVRGGMRWWIELPAGAKRKVRFHYTITISSKEELVGGNRRE